MLIIRHAELRDLDDIFALAEQSGVGLTSLPANKEILAARLDRVQKTIDGQAAKSEQGYLFVLEDPQIQRVVGVSAIEVAVGLTDSFYNYHVGKQVHASKMLNVYKTLETLFLSNDLTGCSELCTLFLDETYRQNQNGKFLSKIRFLFIAAFKEHFEQKLIAEMRGYSDENGNSPFWDAVGYQFFNLDFATADYLSGIGQKAFIAELMPRFPVYANLLPQAARDVIAEVHPHTQPARYVLETEGMKYQGYIDIFDGGPTLEAEICNLRAVQESKCLPVKIVTEIEPQETAYLVANDQYSDYRASLFNQVVDETYIGLTQAQADALHVKQDQKVRILALNTQESS